MPVFLGHKRIFQIADSGALLVTDTLSSSTSGGLHQLLVGQVVTL